MRAGKSSFAQLLAVLVLTVMPILSRAQLTTGNISGSVTDPSGAAVPGANVTIKNVETGLTRATVTGATGRYEVPNVPTGNYEVSASSEGFQTSVRAGIEITAGRNAVVDHALQVGNVAEQVTVTGEAALLETTSATVSQLVDERKVEELPLNNRDLTGLSFLQPGVIKVPTSGVQGVFSGMGDKLSVAGARQTQNAYLLDGVSNADFSGNAQGASGAYLGADTIKEFQIITNNYSAEYPSQAGAIISAVTKSGTNSIHGTVFGYHRNDNLDAANYFDNATPGNVKPEFKRNQFGGSLGGPVIRDKTFFFASYEGLRERLNTTNEARVFSADARRGILPTGTVTINPAVVPFLSLWPVPGEGNAIDRVFPDGTVRIVGTKSTPTNTDFVAGKMDHQFSSQKLGFLSATYNWDDSDRSPFGILGDVGNGGSNGGLGTVSTKHTFSTRLTGTLSNTTVSDFNFGYSWNEIAGEIPLGDRDFTGLTFLPGKERVGQINVGSMDAIGYRVNGSFYNSKVLTFKENISMVRGGHSLRFGGDVSRFDYGQESCSRGCNGIYDFNSVADFLTANPRRFQGFAPGSTSPPFQFKQWLLGMYVQDNWQVTPTLTLNIGLRYELPTVAKEDNDRIANLVDFWAHSSLSAPASIQSQYPNFVFPTTIDDFYKNPGKKSFSPRFGFAWAPGDRKTSLRGGFGIFYEHVQLYQIRTTIQELPPFALVVRIDDSATRNLDFPNVATVNAAQFVNPTFNIRTFDYEPKNTYIYRYSLTLQREVGSSWLVSAGYTGSRALHLWQQGLPNINKWDDFPTNHGPNTPEKHFTAGNGLIKPGLGEIRIQSSNGNSFYNGLALAAQKRMGYGLSAQFSYNFANSIDQGSGVTSGGEELPQGQRGIYFWDMYLKKQPSSFDIRHNFVANFAYELPRTSMGGIGGALINGWQFNGILSLIKGHPLTVLDSNAAQITAIGDEEGLRVDLIPGGDNNPVIGDPTHYFDETQFTPSRIGYFGNLGPNTVRSPGVATFDFSTLKEFGITEDSRIQFRAEFFNLFNRVNFGDPGMTLISPTGQVDLGATQITRAAPARQIQFALKYIF